VGIPTALDYLPRVDQATALGASHFHVLILPLILRPSTLDPMAMPEPGDLIDAFSPQPGRCFRMVQSRQLQADHCYEPPAWKGIWVDVKGRSWYVEACAKHAPKVTSGPADGF
jgi:hypothetical protein